jgi:hypothetical protein
LPTAVGPNGERLAKHGDIVCTAGFGFTSSAQDLATRSAVLMACDAMTKVRSEKSGKPNPGPRAEYWTDELDSLSREQSRLAEQTIDAIAKEAKASKIYELTGWMFGRDHLGCWYGKSRQLDILRTKDGKPRLSGPDDWDWEQRIMPILDRLATDPALNE